MKALDTGKHIISSLTERFRFTIKFGCLGLFFVFLLLFNSTASAVPLEVDSIVQLTNGSEGSPAWSPDGTEIMYSRDGTLYKMALSDQIEVELAVPGGKWSPEGNQVLFLNGSLWVINKDGSLERQIPNTSDAGKYFAWSPDGSKIAYTNGSELILIEPDGSNKQAIYTQPEYPDDGTGWQLGLRNPAWSPDSSKIVVQESMGVEGEAPLTVLNADGTNPIHMGVYGVNGFISQTQPWQSQIWSPDGSKIVFQTFSLIASHDYQVCTINSDGTEAKILTEQGAGFASFSPDGSKIIYHHSDSNGGVTNVWMMDADASNKTQLTTSSAYNYNPVWSPDGTKIVFVDESESNSGIWIINLKEGFVSDGEITVDDDGSADFTTIQAAVDAANDGDTILVSPGIYNENVDVDKSVIIESTGGVEVTTVVGVSEDDYVFDISADQVTLSGFNVNTVSWYSKSSIHISSDSNKIYDNKLFYDGINLSGSNNNEIINNSAVSTGSGITMSYSNNNTISNYRLVPVDGTYTVYGVSMSYSNNNTLIDNSFGANFDYGISLTSSNNNTLIGNSAYADSGSVVKLTNSSHNKLKSNSLSYFMSGIYLSSSSYNTIEGNSCSGTGDTISLSSSNYNLIYNNILAGIGSVQFGGANTGNQWNIEKTEGTSIIGGSYIGGNYWATPEGEAGFSQTGFDIDGDGICDSAYELDADNIDYLPLTTNEVPPDYPRTLTVDDSGGADYASIQAAVNAAIMGESILVYPGTYNENVDVGTKLSISSTDGASVTKVISSSAGDHVFEVTGDGVTISGFSVSGATGVEKAGIYLNSDNNVLADNILEGNVIGIHFVGSNANEIIDNIVSNNTGHGILMYEGSSNNTLTSNTVSGNRGFGVIFAGGSDNILTGNIISGNNGEGIHLGSSNNNVLTSNTVSDNRLSAIFLDATDGNSLISNTFSGSNYGIHMEYSGGNTIYNNLFNNSQNVEFGGTNTGNQWNIEKTAGTNIIGGSYIAGNYWATPDGTGFSQTGVDYGGDGICEYPYELDTDNIDYLSLTDKDPSSPPYPEITSVVVGPQDLHEGDIATITISVNNTGNPSNMGFIAVSFPNNEEIIDVSGTGSGYNKLFSIGDSITTSTSSRIPAVNPLVELYESDWASGQTETLTIKVKPNDGASELRFYVRATLREQSVAYYIRNPASSSITDQQGFYVTEHSADIASQVLTATITSIDPNPVNEDNSVSFAGEGTVAFGEIVGYRWSSSIDGDLSSSASFSTTDLSLGVHTISFSIQDNYGGWSEASTSSLTVTDGVAPEVSISASLLENISVNNPVKINLYVSDSHLESTVMSIVDLNGIEILSQDVGNDNSTIASLEYVWNATNSGSTPVNSGEYQVFVNSTDVSGNFASESITIYVDNDKPNVNIDSIDGFTSGDNIVYASANVSVSGTASGTPGEALSVRYTLYSLFTSYRKSVDAELVNGKWEAVFDLSSIPDDGHYSINATAFDAANNMNSTSSDTLVVIDRVVPVFLTTVSWYNETHGIVAVTSSEPLAGSPTVDVNSDYFIEVDLIDGEWIGYFLLGDEQTFNVSSTGTDIAGNAGSDTSVVSRDRLEFVGGTGSYISQSGTSIVFDSKNDSSGNIIVSESLNEVNNQTGEAIVAYSIDVQLDASLKGNMSGALIAIPTDSVILPDGTTKEDFSIRHYNDSLEVWERCLTSIETVDGKECWTTYVTHFSTYGVVMDDITTPVVSVTPGIGTVFDEGTSSVDIRFNFSDEQTGINVSSVVFKFNGNVITDASLEITSSYALYTASGLSSGTYSAFVYVEDKAGNDVTSSTSFTISTQSGSGSSGSSSSSSSSSGGGGGGSTGEVYENIAVKEVESIYLSKDMHVVYLFSEEGNAISSIQFDSLKNSGRIQTIIEVLKDRSSFAKEDAPGNAYQQMNIWVGKSGFINSDNVDNLLITFKVEKSWLIENNIDAGAVKFYRYSDDTWKSLLVNLIGEDDAYVYYESETPGFSAFAICAGNGSGYTDDGSTLQSITGESAGSIADHVPETETGLSGIGTTSILIMLGLFAVVLIGGYILYRKQN